ncbi:MAG: hypothetical protein PVI44_13895 [Balneolaceae bacterium]|jgi:hypothetical protein
MFGNNEYVGFTLQDDVIRVARLRLDGKKLKLVKLDRFSLVEKMKTDLQLKEPENDREDMSFEENEDADAIFGLEEGEGEEEDEEIDFEDLEAAGEAEEDMALDMVEESQTVQSNELLVYNILSDIDPQKVHLGLNIPAGSTIFQIIRDTDFKEVKKKDLVQDLEEKLESIYGMPKSPDNYSYEIREDGSLLLGSIDEESITLQLVNRAREFYNGKITVEDIIPDEIGLVGLVRANYDLEPDEMTGVIQFGKQSCRVVFMKGEEVWLVSPIINEGTEKKSFLNTVFSKILFQLDTGEVPNLDRIILANNTRGDSAVKFFRENFPDIHVENLKLKEDFFDSQNIDPSSVASFTTAIGAALAASKTREEHFPKLSFVPKYVADRQKIFKLQWHGVLILFLIFLTPITFNYFYNQNAKRISSLSSELSQMKGQIKAITPTVNSANELNQNLSILKEKLTMLDTLSRGSREWSEKFRILDQGVRNVKSSWITSFSQTKQGAFIQGYTLYRNRIPELVNIFDEATLLSVNDEEVRDKQIYSFSIFVKSFTKADSIYSPPKPKEVKNLIEQ